MPQLRLAMEVMVVMAVDTEDMVAAMEAIEVMERGLQKLKPMLSQDTSAEDMAADMVDMEAAMEDMVVMDVDTVMARGLLMLRP